MIVATAGHVDHGKTLLVKALTGTDTDRLPEEKKRGLTIDLGFAYHDLGDGRTTGFIDVPGHERFIRTMVAGVSGIDVVLFIIAADDGPMPQTAEHLAILDLLGVTRGVVALTKIDRVDPARVDEVCDACETLLAGTPLADSPVVPVSAMTGDGIDALRGHLLDVARGLEARTSSGNFRLAVDRSFLLKGAGRVVTGTVFSGAIGSGEEVQHVPGGGVLRIRSIHAQNAESTAATAGQRCALNVTGAGLREGDIHRGDWIVQPAAATATRRLDVELRVLASEGRALANRTPVHVHIGAADVTGRIVTVDGEAIEAGDSGLAHLQLDHELHAVHGDRIVLRDQSARRTIGGGVVCDPLPLVRGHRREARLAMFAAMRNDDHGAALEALLAARPDGADIERFARARNLRADELEALLEAHAPVLIDSGAARLAFSAARWKALRELLVPALKACHAADPERAGANEAELARHLPERIKPRLLALLVEEAVEAGDIERVSGSLRVPGHAVQRSPAEEALWRRVERLLDVKDGKAPVVHDMLDKVPVDLKPLQGFLNKSAQQGHLVKVSDKRYFLPATIARFERFVEDLATTQPGGTFTVKDFRDRAGIGRNAVVEILEYFDKAGLTRREGESRKMIRSRS